MGLFLAWAVGEGIITARWVKAKAPPAPGALLLPTALYLSLAETWLKKGQPRQAMNCLERVIQTLPGTRQAEAAQLRLSQIQGQPTQRADFKGP